MICKNCGGPPPLDCSLPRCPFSGGLLPAFMPPEDRPVVRCASAGCHNEVTPLGGIRCRPCDDRVGMVGIERPLKPDILNERR